MSGYKVGSAGWTYYPQEGDCCPLWHLSTYQGGWVRTFNAGHPRQIWNEANENDCATVWQAGANYYFACPEPGTPQYEHREEWSRLDCDQRVASERLRAELWRETHWLTKPDVLAHCKALGFKLTKSSPGYIRTERDGRWLDFRKFRGSAGWYPSLGWHGTGNLHTRAALEAALAREIQEAAA